jgi:hypothetical protein
MRRRERIALVGGMAVAWPLGARAAAIDAGSVQQATLPVGGFANGQGPKDRDGNPPRPFGPWAESNADAYAAAALLDFA